MAVADTVSASRTQAVAAPPDAASRPGLVARPRLSRALANPATAAPVIIQAPSGYGKTALLNEWAQIETRPVARVRVTPELEEPAALLLALRRALRGAGIPGLDPAHEVAGAGNLRALVERTVAAVKAAPRPFVVAVDDAHRAHPVIARTLFDALVEALPPRSQLIVSGRPNGPKPWHRLQSSASATVVTGRHLALNAAEVRALLAARGVTVRDDALGFLVGRTEGWPALVYLVAGSLARADDVSAAIGRLRGTDRLIATYLEEAVLNDLDPRIRRFLEDTSVARRLTGTLCDAMLDVTNCTALLRSLVAGGWSFIVPVDAEQRTYRYHPLLAELLRVRLDQRNPAHRVELCRRGSRWCEERGHIDDAIELAARAGDATRAGDLALPVLLDGLASGRTSRLRSSLRLLGDDAVERTPALALVQCWLLLGDGDVTGAHRWLAMAFAAMASSPTPCAPYTLHAARCTRALAGVGGIDHVLRDAVSVEPLGPGLNPWWILASTLRGHGHLLMGELDEARFELREVKPIAAANVLLHAAALGNLALLELSAGHLSEADALATQATTELAHHHVGRNDLTVLAHAVAALTAAHHGRAADARARVRLATERLDALAAPRNRIAAAVLGAEALAELGDTAGAESLLSRAEGLLGREPRARLLHDRCRTLRGHLGPAPAQPDDVIDLDPRVELDLREQLEHG